MKQIEVYDHKNNCYGCNACRNICPVKAITTQSDEEGFHYPIIDPIICIKCGRCKSVCPIYPIGNENNHYQQQVYAVKHKDEAMRYASTSGGMFTAVSDFILEMGGAVYGVTFDETLRVCHQRAITREKRDEMRGSKYVQSDLGDVFKYIKEDLTDGKRVLFTGTPCQITGLKKYLVGTDDTNLILCDIVCHGVPSNLMWHEYIKFIEKTCKTPLKTHYFRTKIDGWHRKSSVNIFFNKKEDSESILSEVYERLFYSDLLLRPCCYNCKYASLKRYSDITMGDFWGIERSLPEFDDNRGVSLVLINTQKGHDLFTALLGNLIVKESSTADCLQHNLMHPTVLPFQRDQFWKEYSEYGYEFVIKKYAGFTLTNRAKQTIKKLMKRI